MINSDTRQHRGRRQGVGAVVVRVGDGTGEFRLPEAQTIEEVARRVNPVWGRGPQGALNPHA